MSDTALFESFPYALGVVPRPTGDARALSDILENLRRSGRSSHRICERIARLLRGNPHDQLASALLAIADEADRSGLGNPYHNPLHSLEIGVIWLNLALIGDRLVLSRDAVRLDRQDFLLGCCAAFGHDIHHDGRGNETLGPGNTRTYVPFRLEGRAADFVGATLASFGIGAEAIVRARCAILLTDVVQGYPVLEAALKPDFDPIKAGAVRPEFAALSEPRTLLVSTILRDADVLQSAGLTARDHDRQTAALEAERGLPRHALGPAGAENFIGRLLGGRFLSPGGQRFQASMDDLRGLNRRRLEDRASARLNLETIARRYVASAPG